jgi:hypothetical protein
MNAFPYERFSDERLERRDVRVAGLHVLDDLFQGDDQVLRLLLRHRNLLSRVPARLERGRQNYFLRKR